MKYQFKLTIWVVSLTFLFLGSCSKTPTNVEPVEKVETPQDQGRGVKGTLLDKSNNPVSGVFVRINSVNFIPSFSAKRFATIVETTNTNGEFEFFNVDSGIYNIEGEKDSLVILIDSVEVPNDTNDVVIPPGILKKFGVITGITHMPGQNDTNQVRVTLYMPGTRRTTKPNIGGRFTFNLMAEGDYQLIIDPTLNDYNVKVLDLSVTSGDTLDLDTVLLAIYEPDTIVINSQSIFGKWGPNKVYQINNRVEVQQGSSLEIFPNTKILMMGKLEFRVFGNLKAIGKPDSMILFTYGLPNPAINSWSGFNGGIGAVPSPDTMILKYCVFEYFGSIYTGGGFDPTYLDISNCVFRYCRVGISVGGDSVSIANCIFHDISSYGFNSNLKGESIINCIFSEVTNGFRVEKQSVNLSYSTIFMVDTIGIDFNDKEFFLTDSTGLIFSDPKFVSLVPGGEDYHLQSDSPSKGTGINGTDMGIYSTYVP